MCKYSDFLRQAEQSSAVDALICELRRANYSKLPWVRFSKKKIVNQEGILENVIAITIRNLRDLTQIVSGVDGIVLCRGSYDHFTYPGWTFDTHSFVTSDGTKVASYVLV